jgi:phosphoketolase
MYKYKCLKNGEIIEVAAQINSPFFVLVDSKEKATFQPPFPKKETTKESEKEDIEDDLFSEHPNDLFDERESLSDAPVEEVEEEKKPKTKPKRNKRK